MKIQELAIIFIIIILPISIILSAYTQFQIQTINTQTLYDSRLTAATYDTIRAFQLNTGNETYSDLANEKLVDLEASINTFRNSIMTAFKLNGYTEDDLNNYIPALVYTLYDGFYIYSPYENTNYKYEIQRDDNKNEIRDPVTGELLYETDAEGNRIPIDDNGKNIYGLKPYISYSCRYIKGNIDVVITYALDNYVTVQGKINDEYVNKGGYLIDGIKINRDANDIVTKVEYNGVEITTEHLREVIGEDVYSYVKKNGTKYYYIENAPSGEPCIARISNGKVIMQTSNDDEVDKWKTLIENNNMAQQYYIQAKDFTNWFKDSRIR